MKDIVQLRHVPLTCVECILVWFNVNELKNSLGPCGRGTSLSTLRPCINCHCLEFCSWHDSEISEIVLLLCTIETHFYHGSTLSTLGLGPSIHDRAQWHTGWIQLTETVSRRVDDSSEEAIRASWIWVTTLWLMPEECRCHPIMTNRCRHVVVRKEIVHQKEGWLWQYWSFR